MIRPAERSDAEAIAQLYNHYILNTAITFEEQAVTAQEIASRIERIGAASLPWLVAVASARLVGYAYASPWHGRCAYRFTVENAIYVDPAATGQGIGSQLFQELLRQLRARDYHAVIGGIALPNEASVRLHEKFGFQKVAHFKEVGFKFSRWIDVGYWQKNWENID